MRLASKHSVLAKLRLVGGGQRPCWILIVLLTTSTPDGWINGSDCLSDVVCSLPYIYLTVVQSFLALFAKLRALKATALPLTVLPFSVSLVDILSA